MFIGGPYIIIFVGGSAFIAWVPIALVFFCVCVCFRFQLLSIFRSSCFYCSCWLPCSNCCLCFTCCHTLIFYNLTFDERERERERERDRQTDRQTDRHTDRHITGIPSKRRTSTRKLHIHYGKLNEGFTSSPSLDAVILAFEMVTSFLSPLSPLLPSLVPPPTLSSLRFLPSDTFSCPHLIPSIAHPPSSPSHSSVEQW